MPQINAPLSSYPVVHSGDAELVRDLLLNVYGANRFSVNGSEDHFWAHANHLQLTDMALSYCAYGTAVTLGFPEAGFIRQIFNIEGTGRFKSGGSSGDITRGYWTPVISDETPLELELSPRYQQLVLRIEFEALQRHVNAIVGKASDRKLEFLENGTRGNPAISNLRRRIFHFAFDFNTRGTLFSSLAAAEIERAIIVNFLLCHQHNYTNFFLRDPAPALASTVRIVEEYIEANWEQPLDITTLAGIANVSARTLFRQFQQVRRYSPAEFAKRIRLQRASEMLIQPGENTTVTQVALRCGFQNLGHFANDYRNAFGELPSDTLERAVKK